MPFRELRVSPRPASCSADDVSRRKVALYAAAGGAALVVLISAILAVKLLPHPNGDGALFASPRAACSYTGALTKYSKIIRQAPSNSTCRPRPCSTAGLPCCVIVGTLNGV